MWRARDAQVPMGHMGDAWDVANAALFLASDESKYVTGIELVVDGGITLQGGLMRRLDIDASGKRAPSPAQLGFTRVGSWASIFVEVGYIRLRWERVGVRGYALSIGHNPLPGLLRNPTSPSGRGEHATRRTSSLRASPCRD